MHRSTWRESETKIALSAAMKAFLIIAFCVAIALGIWHLTLALQAIFVFRAGEPIVSWIAILCGPASTLPAALLAIFSRRAGAYWLIGGGIISFLVFAIGEGVASDNLLPFLSRISIPMVVMGAILVYLRAAPPKLAV
jgi:hypothetical protein